MPAGMNSAIMKLASISPTAAARQILAKRDQGRRERNDAPSSTAPGMKATFHSIQTVP